jgi:hypothetical protein
MMMFSCGRNPVPTLQRPCLIGVDAAQKSPNPRASTRVASSSTTMNSRSLREAPNTAFEDSSLEISESVEEEINQCEQEARMVLPGIQALFGFQLMATFNPNFKTLLSQNLQNLHLVALVCVALSVMLVLTPAAYHRQAESGKVSRYFADLASRFLSLGMVPLMFGIVLDVFVISFLVTQSRATALITSVALLVGFVSLWFIFPRFCRRRNGAQPG